MIEKMIFCVWFFTIGICLRFVICDLEFFEIPLILLTVLSFDYLRCVFPLQFCLNHLLQLRF
jgi:hypothetical protein